MTAESASVQFIGTATTLIRYGDLCILTDPNLLQQGERAYLGYGLTAKRRTEPALGVAELPPLDGIVLSHLHGDHWDRRAQRGLSRELPIMATPPAPRRLKLRDSRRASGLPTWHSSRLAGRRACIPTRGGPMAEPTDPTEAINDGPVPQPGRPVGSRPDSDWTAVSGTGDAEYGQPAAERTGADRPFATSADSALDSDLNRRIPAADSATAAQDAQSAAEDQLPGGSERAAEQSGVPDADPSEDLAAGPPDGR